MFTFVLTVAESLVRSAHEQTISRLPSRSTASPTALAAGLVAGGPLGAVCGGGGGGVGSVSDLRDVRRGRRSGAGGVRPADDGAAADLRVLPRGGQFAAGRAGDIRRRSVPISGCRPTPRSRQHRGFPRGALDWALTTVRARVGAVLGSGATGAVGRWAGRDQR